MTKHENLSKLLLMVWLSWVLVGVSTGHALENPKTTSFEINSGLGANLNKDNRQSSLTLSPEINYRPDPNTQLSFSTLIDRPTSANSKVWLPTLNLTGMKDLDPTGALDPNVSLSFSLLSLDKLDSEGLSIRTRPALGVALQLFSFLGISGRMGPYLVLSQYRQFANGEPKPRFGINELIETELTVKSWKLSVALVIDQAYTNFWRNNFSSTESLQYMISKSFSVGLSHSILSSVIDDTTGFYRTVPTYADRLSRVSLFVDATL